MRVGSPDMDSHAILFIFSVSEGILFTAQSDLLITLWISLIN